MGRLEVTIADGGMLARVQVHRGPPSALAELRAALAAAGVVRGIDEPALQRLAQRLDDPLTELALEIAHGSSPIDGDDGRLQGDLLGGRIAGVAAADGSIDFRERHGLRAAAVGDVVAEILPATTGTAGHDVRGRALPSRPGKPHRQKAGRGVRREGDALIATVDGVVLCTDTTIDVVPLHVHAGDVDYRSGNLHTKGALVVQGDVGDGFAVTAGGDLVIAGTLQGSKARAGGRIEVERGIVGATASARSGSDIRCHHATAARLVAENTIEITDQCMQASVHAPRIHVAGERGAVRGGELRCRTSIDVTTAGSAAGIRTVLVAGDPLDERVELARRSLATARLDRRAARDSGSKALRAAVRAGDHEQQERLRLRQRQAELLAAAVIRVSDTCHGGVVLRFGNAEFSPDTALGPSAFRYDSERRTIVRGEL